MKKSLLLAMLLAVTTSASAQADASTITIESRAGTAEQLVNHCKKLENVDLAKHLAPRGDQYDIGFCVGFVLGIIDSESFLVKMDNEFGQKGAKMLACIPQNATTTQLAKVMVKYGNDHPEGLSDPAIEFAYVALLSVFPCK